CDPVNDTRAPVCQDAGPAVFGCLSCAQILNVALSNGDQLGPLACAGPAQTHWTALTGCVTAACGSACSGVMPTNDCVGCFEQPDAMGGCANEAMACTSNCRRAAPPVSARGPPREARPPPPASRPQRETDRRRERRGGAVAATAAASD